MVNYKLFILYFLFHFNKLKMKSQKNILAGKSVSLFIILFVIISSSQATAQGEITNTLEATVCCEKTQSGLFCQDVPEDECGSDSRTFPTACESTSFCKPGFCSDPTEGTCLGNVPQLVCNEEGGTFYDDRPPQCELGCCVLGDQASFVTLTRCKRLSSFLGLETNYNPEIANEAACILIASASEKGACVYIENEADLQPTCKMTTRAECTPGNILGENSGTEVVEEGVSSNELEGLVPTEEENAITEETPEESNVQTGPEVGEVIFNPGMLCAAEVLETDCGPSQETICLAGKEEIYFVDTCGNPANIYDASKINDDNYWTFIKDKSESCGPSNGNADSQTCGNCNYLLGTFCRASSSETARATHGNNICQNLNCEASEESGGEARLHGESWCVYDEDVNFVARSTGLTGINEDARNEIADSASKEFNERLSSFVEQAVSRYAAGRGVGTAFLSSSEASVGSRYYRRICLNGEIVTEPCADFRQHECIENVRETSVGEFTEAACRVNRWQDCTSQTLKSDCVNTDIRDCKWLDGIGYVLMGSILNGTTIDQASLQTAAAGKKEFELGNRDLGACVPEHPPGLKFWEGDEARGICGQANAICPVTYEKGIGGDWECVKNCECLPGGKLEAQRVQLCMQMGDCGPKVNIAGDKGRGKGYKITDRKIDDDDD